MERRWRVFYTRNTSAAWAVDDGTALAQEFDVRELDHRRLGSVGKVVAGVLWCDIVVCRFANRIALLAVALARLLHKPAVVVVGGYDTAAVPEMNYGSLRGGPVRWMTLAIFKLADRLLPTSYTAGREARANGGVLESKILVIPNGYPEIPAPTVAKQPIVITVGNIIAENVVRKGLAAFVEVARAMPEVRFVMVGRADAEGEAWLASCRPANLETPGFLSEADRDALYGQATVYVQLSLHEAFGSSVAEAMLLRCIPVVSDRGALPEVVADAGFVVPYGDTTAAIAAVREALAAPAEAGDRARAKILRDYRIEDRDRQLRQVVRELLAGGSGRD